MTVRKAASLRGIGRYVAIAAVLCIGQMASASTVFWSNGDHTASTQPLGFNEINPTFNRQFFEDFSVTSPGGITITGLWSDNLIPRGSAGSILSLEWSVRTLMTESDDGVPIIKYPSGSWSLFVGGHSAARTRHTLL